MLCRTLTISIIVLINLFYLPISYAVEKEYILNFESNIVVNQDASIDVTEIITVYANQNKIKRGLVRRLPTVYTDNAGVSYTTYYHLQRVLVNDIPSKYHTEYTNRQLQIYIGDRDIILSPGIYSYLIQYRVEDAINFLKDKDEFYWNVTGNDWDFPIQKADATITLPQNTAISNYSAYTGPYGSQEKNVTVTQPYPNQIKFSTTYGLSRNEGLTVAVAWPKGIIHQATTVENLKSKLKHNYGYVISLEITLLLFCYYLVIWHWFGRDPKKGTIIPLFEPPKALSAPATRYLMRMNFDMKTVSAMIVGLAVKGFLNIKDNGIKIIINKTEPLPQTPLSEEEQAFMNSFFEESNMVALTNRNITILTDASKTLASSLKAQFKNKYFITNSIYLIPGILLGLLALGTAIVPSPNPKETLFLSIWLSIWTLVCCLLIYRVSLDYRAFSTRHTVINFGRLLSSVLLALIFSGVAISVFFLFSRVIPMITFLIIFFMILLNLFFYYLLKAPTEMGRKVMDDIEGFKLFLGTTERYRLNKLHPPDITPALFEKYLPFAIALNVETQWAQNFNASLERAMQPSTSYQPTWYQGTGAWNLNTLSAISNQLNSALVSTSPSSGGGFSGGGRGGGGGGGW